MHEMHSIKNNLLAFLIYYNNHDVMFMIIRSNLWGLIITILNCLELNYYEALVNVIARLYMG